MQVAVVIAIVIAVLFYRLAVSGLIYHLVASITGGPSAADIAVSITGAAIQLISIVILNKVYEYLAIFLNNWGKWRVCGRQQLGKRVIQVVSLFMAFNNHSCGTHV